MNFIPRKRTAVLVGAGSPWDYFRKEKDDTMGGSFASPLQTERKQMMLRTSTKILNRPMAIQPIMGMSVPTMDTRVAQT